MIQSETYLRMTDELEAYYSHLDPDTERLLTLLEEMCSCHENDSSYIRKAAMHETLSAECRIHLFRNFPFFFEMASGRPRFSWGGLQSPVGCFFDQKTAGEWLNPYVDEIEEDCREGYFRGWRPTGIDHHALGYDRILRDGFDTILADHEARCAAAKDERTRDFHAAVSRSIRALLHIQFRFAALAASLADSASDETERQHYKKIAEAAKRVPAKTPRSFYEALCAVLFCREVISSIEGIGVSTLGHLDRMLYPFYKGDLAVGRITRTEAAELLHALLSYTEIRFNMRKEQKETSTTVILGGCDAAGDIVYNDLTKLILEVLVEGRYIGTKINCRISTRHPDEYLNNLADVQLANLPVIVMQNDGVIIPARIAQGQSAEDSRLYVSGGCHEIVLQNTEVNTRADSWISLPRIFLKTLSESTAASFSDFYADFLRDVRVYYDRIIVLKNKYEKFWCACNPLPLYSSTVTGCAASGRDVTEGGAKYSTTALSFLGTASCIDSLYSVKHLVYDTEKLTLEQLRDVLSADFKNDEYLRQYILHKIPKYGTNNEILNKFSADVLADLSTVPEGRLNARGGKYLPAFYPHDIFRKFGEITGATPDGRHAGMPLSRGCSPNEFIEVENPLDILHSLSHIDFTKWADSFCTEMTLPPMEKSVGRHVLTVLIKTFMEQGGSSLQFNLLDRALLLEAQKHPEEHTDLIVRVCGYSEVFVYLNSAQQAEILARAIR